MANILGLITVNNKEILEVDGVPSAAAGTAAPIGSLAFYDDGAGLGQNYVKVGAADTAWDLVVTEESGTNVGQGDFLRLAIYDTNASGYHLDDTVAQNSQNIDVAIQAQPTRSAAIEYRVPNPGDAITTADFILSEGAQTKNGNMTFNNDVIVQGDLTVNGSLTYLNTTNTQITDALITLNKGGAAGSGSGVGFEIEENAVITGYFKTAADRAGFELLAPAGSFKNDLDLSLLTGNRTQKFADTDGVFVMRAQASPGVAGQLAFYQDANKILSDSGLAWDNTGKVLTATNMVAVSSLKGSYLTQGSVVFVGASGLLTQDNAKFFWDDSTYRLGVNVASPARTLDVGGSSLFHGAMKFTDAGAALANWEMLQAQVQTTDATVTTLASISIPTDSQSLVTARIQGRRTGGVAGADGDSATYVRTVQVNNIGGTLSRGPINADYTSEDQKAWDGTFDISGTALRVRVTGAADNNIDWTVTYTVQNVQ